MTGVQRLQLGHCPPVSGTNATVTGFPRGPSAIAGVCQHATQVDDHLLVDVLAGGRHEEFELWPDLDGNLAVMTHGNLTDGFEQRHDGPPLYVVAGRMIQDLPQRVAMMAVKMF